MTVEEQRQQDLELINQIQSNLDEFKRLIMKAESTGLHIQIERMSDPRNIDLGTWPVIQSAGRQEIYFDISRKPWK